MSISNCLLRRQIAICLVLFLVSPFWDTGMAHAQQGSADQQAEGASSAQAQSPSATGQVKSGSATAESEASSAATKVANSQTPGNDQQAVPQQDASKQQQSGTSEPVGTAAAPYEKPLGVAASRPAGAAIAPAKQKRAGSILIKVGVIVAAAVAVGTVVALSSGSPSRPH